MNGEECKTTVKFRQCNMELLRVFSMLFIIIHHLLLNGIGFSNVADVDLTLSSEKLIYGICGCLEPFVIIGVNLFFLLSGYFGIRFSWKKCFLITFSLYAYMFIIQSFGVFTGFNTLNSELIKLVLFSFESYWFLEVYIFLMILAPLLNLIIEHSGQYEAKIFLFNFVVFFSAYTFIFNSKHLGVNRGYSLVFACCLYLVGAFIKKKYIFQGFNSMKKSFLFYISFSAISSFIIGVSIVVFESGRIAGVALTYNNPLVVFASISFFLMFVNVKLKDDSKLADFIRYISKNILGVYILHSSNKVLVYYRNWPLAELMLTGKFTLALLLVIPYALCIFVLCTFIDKGFQKTVGNAIRKVSVRLGNVMDNIQLSVSKYL